MHLTMKIKKNKTLLLSASDVQEIILNEGLDQVMDALIERLEKAIQNYSAEEIDIPMRSGFNYENPVTGLIEWMPLYHKGNDVMMKVVGYHPDNPSERNLPTIISSISAYCTKTGHLKGIIDGVLPTALRTGASSAVISRILAKKEAKILGLIGCGAQAITQLHALSRVFDFEKILVYDTDKSTLNSFAQRSAVLNLNIPIEATEIKEIVGHADILCTATSVDVGAGPLFNGIESQAHLHINAVGADFPGKIEIPLSFLEKSFVCPDFKLQALVEGECQQLDEKNIGSEWMEVIQNQQDYIKYRDEKTVFDSTGWALEDWVAMELFMEYAVKLGLGTEVELESISEDPKNPYEFMREMPVETLVLREIEYLKK